MTSRRTIASETKMLSIYDIANDFEPKDEVKILTQFQNERTLKSLTNRMINEWTTLALDVMVVH